MVERVRCAGQAGKVRAVQTPVQTSTGGSREQRPRTIVAGAPTLAGVLIIPAVVATIEAPWLSRLL